MKTELYDEITQNRAEFHAKLTQTAKDYFPFIVLLFNISLSVLSQLYRIGFVNPLSVEYILDLCVSLSSTMLCYACFIPLGKKSEKDKGSSYSANLIAWSELSGTVRQKGLTRRFSEFCFDQLDIERDERRREIICNHSMISYEQYVNEYKGLSKKQTKRLVQAKRITPAQKKTIDRANANIRVKPINPLLILCGVAHSSFNDAGRKSGAYASTWLMTRPLIIIATSLVINAIQGSWNEMDGIAALYDMFIAILGIIIASTVGYSVGKKTIQKENDKIKTRIVFLQEFIECEEKRGA